MEINLDKDAQKSLKQIIDYRIKKVNELIKDGLNPFPYKFDKEYDISYILNNEDSLDGKLVSTAGRIVSLRNMGKASFMNIQDQDSKIQLYVKNDLIGLEQYEKVVKKLDIGDIIGVSGNLFRTKTNQLSLKLSSLNLLSKSIRPLPNIKEKDDHMFFAFDDKENKYRNRHLDLIVNQNSRNVFKLRSNILFEIRKILNQKGFMEVETPILQNIHGGAAARPFITHHNTLDQNFYLRIAEELHLKRLLIGGFEKIYEIGRNFRNEGIDRTHNPEFTMLELYEAYSDMEGMMILCEELIQDINKKNDKKIISFMGHSIDLSKKFTKISMSELLNNELGCDVINMSVNELYNLCKKYKIEVDKKMNFGQLFDKLFSNLIEPKLIQPTFVFDYPKSISPLAKVHRDNDLLVERFELFIAGMEFANAFSELNDPLDQRQRFEDQLKLKETGDEEAHAMDEEFVEAMEFGMPPTGGIGIGIDRLIMLFSEQDSIKDVILFPSLRNK